MSNAEHGIRNVELSASPTYFDTPERLALLRAGAEQLRGTPFFANSEAPGAKGGIDCVHTLNWIYRFCGVIGPISIPRQQMDAGHHADHSLLIEAFETWPALCSRFACVWKRSAVGDQPSASRSELVVRHTSVVTEHLLPGDALCFLAGKVPHHGGVFLGEGDFLHALKRDGVHTLRLDAVLRGWRPLGLLAAVYRPLPVTSDQCHVTSRSDPDSSLITAH